MLWAENDSHGENVVDFLKGDMLVLHLVPNGIRAFHTFLEHILYAHVVESLAYGRRELVEEFVS